MVEKEKLRSKLLDMMKLGHEVVEIEKTKVYVHELGAADFTNLWIDPKNEKIVGEHLVDGKKENKTEVDMRRLTACLIVKSCKTKAGECIFSDEDIDFVMNSKKEIFSTLAEVARRLNGMGGVSKNSEAISSDSSSGESQLALDLGTPTS